MNYTISNGIYTAPVSSHGAELISIKHNLSDSEIIWQSNNEQFWSKHSPLLFPFCGRLKDKKYSYRGYSYGMSAHGFISGKEFSLISNTADTVVLEFTSDAETLAVYPFSFTFVASYKLSDNGIECKVSVTNTGDEVMPFMFGWHPGFMLPNGNDAEIESYEIFFDKNLKSVTWIPLQHGCFARIHGEEYVLGGGKYRLNEEEIYKNDTMIFKGCPNSATLRSCASGYSLSLKWSKNTPVLCIWKEPSSEARFICIEPWSNSIGDGESDEVLEKRDMIRLGTGKTEVFTYCFGLSQA